MGFRLYCGDALEVLRSMPAQSFDVVFADPPYFLSNGGSTCHAGKRVKVDKGAWDASRGMQADYDFTVQWLTLVRGLLRPSGSLWVSGTHHVIFLVGYALQQLGFRTLNTITWYKPNAAPNLACRYFTHSTELIIWAGPPGPPRHVFNYPEMKALNGGKQMRDVWALPPRAEVELADNGGGVVWTMVRPGKSEKSFGAHPTQKPVALLERILAASAPPRAKVLDPFCGSGTTGVAARKLGHDFWGVEVDATYLELATRRITALPVPD